MVRVGKVEGDCDNFPMQRTNVELCGHVVKPRRLLCNNVSKMGSLWFVSLLLRVQSDSIIPHRCRACVIWNINKRVPVCRAPSARLHETPRP